MRRHTFLRRNAVWQWSPSRWPNRRFGGLGDQMDLFSFVVGLVVGLMIGGTVVFIVMAMVRGGRED